MGKEDYFQAKNKSGEEKTIDEKFNDYYNWVVKGSFTPHVSKELFSDVYKKKGISSIKDEMIHLVYKNNLWMSKSVYVRGESIKYEISTIELMVFPDAKAFLYFNTKIPNGNINKISNFQNYMRENHNLPDVILESINYLGMDKENFDFPKMKILSVINGETLKKYTKTLKKWDNIPKLEDILLQTIGTVAPSNTFFIENSNLLPSENYFNKLIENNKIDIWNGWSGLALNDTLTFVGENSFDIYRNAFSSYFYIYILTLYQNIKLYEFMENIVVKNYTDNPDQIDEQKENYVNFDNIYHSYKVSKSFQPNIIYSKLQNILEIEELNSEIKDDIEEIYNHKKRKKADSVEFMLMILTVVSLAAALLSMNTHYRIPNEEGKISSFDVFLTFGNLIFLGLVGVFALIIYLYNNKDKIKRRRK